MAKRLSVLGAVAVGLLACACNTTDEPTSTSSARSGGVGLLGDSAAGLALGRGERKADDISGSRSGVQSAAFVDLGTGSTARDRAGVDEERVSISDDGSKVTLNFVNADVQEFLRVVFDDVLKQSVVIDSSLQARVTVRTSEPVSRKVALDIVKNVLQLNGISLSQSNGIYKAAARQSGGGGGDRGAVRIVPLKFIDAEQARVALQPLAGSVQVSANGDGRYLLLSGQPGEIDPLVQAIEALDVDSLKGVAFGLYPLKEANAQAVSNELTQMFQSGAKGFKALPVQRMNAVLIMSRSSEQLGRAQAWVRRLDQAGRDDRRVQVYPVQNRRAADIAQVLNGILGAGSGGPAPAQTDHGKVAPAFSSVMGSGPPQATQTGVQVASLAGGADASPMPTASSYAEPMSNVQVRADPSTNSIVVVGKPEDQRLVESALRRLDIMPSQVLIEATIAEVTLNNALNHGVRWYLQSGNHSSLFTSSEQGSTGSVVPGFNYAFTIPQARVVISALEKVTDVEIISSPALTVLDNQTANLKVGDQVPIAVRSARSVATPDAPTVSEIEMKDTGIILSVTPRVNSGGLVTLDVSQEVSDVVPTTTSNLDSPTIRQRKVTSTISAQSGDEIVLGGLISTKREKSKDGIPFLMDIPVLGNAFVSNGKHGKGRTELLIIIRPSVMTSRVDVQAVTAEIKSRMQQTSSAINRR
jgi:general secretion pathway protein D